MKVVKYEVLGELPDPFIKEDGSRIVSADEWKNHREFLKKSSVILQYGDILPEPEFLDVQLLGPPEFGALDTALIKVTTGKKSSPVSFTMVVYLPKNYERGCKYPVVIDGDLCYKYAVQKSHNDYYANNGIIYACFARNELVYDCAWRKTREEGEKGPIYDTYGKDCTFGCFQGWSWGFSRTLDALIKFGAVDLRYVAFTGHSRGAKSALLAAALDERCTVCLPVQTNAGGAACYRSHLFAFTSDGEEKRSETLEDMALNFPHWYPEEMCSYATKEAELPFDSHFLKSLIAPRHLIVGEAEDDIWGNSIGSYQTNDAAKPVFEFLGVPDNINWYWHKGKHSYTPEDSKILAEYLSALSKGEKPDLSFNCRPFEEYGKNFDYTAP